MNSVRVLSLAIGRNYTYETRLELKRLGPPRPNLNIVQVQNACKSKSSYARKFNASMYDLADWLCGCDSKNAFFCYTCLVMNVYDPGWTTIGVADIKHIREKVKKHKSSGKHIQGAIDYEMLGKVDIRCQLDSAYRLQIKQFNEEVSKNRYILGKLIDCIKVCGKFELASQEHNEKETSDNPGIFRGLINLMGELDSRLKEHIEKTNSQVFMGLSKTIQNDLLDSIYAVCIKLIRQEISKADFIAIEVDETTDCATLSQLVFIVRYVLGGEIFERFITFIVPKSRDAQGVTSAILGELEKLEINKSPNKLIAQSYDGSSVMSGQDTGVQALVRAVYNNAQFIHCYAHQLYLVIERCATQSKQVKTFFSSLEGFSSFFTKSTKRTAVLDHVLRKRITQNTATIWSCKEICVNIVHTYKKEINECLEIIADDPTSDYSTCRKATGLKNFLKDHDFLFWLRFFNIVLPHSGILFNAQQQQREIDSVKTRKNIKNFKTTIKKIRKSLDVGQEWLVESNTAQDPLRFDFENREVAKEVCDVILTCIEERFKFSDHLSVALLLQPSLFHKHRILFPENELKMAVKLFSLNPMELKQELTVIYNRTDFSNASGALPLLRYIYENNLEGLLPESVKLLRIICTIPMTTAESERRFSTLKRIKTFTRNTMKEDKLNALAMCSIEKDLLSTQNFNELVINQFAEQKERRMDFIYKQINYNWGNSNTGSKETEVDTAASTSTSQSVVAVSNLSSLNENAGGISDSESEEDSNHSADILPLQEELLQDSTSQHTVLLSETASSVNSDTLILPSTSSSVVRDAEIPSSSHAVSSTAQSNSAIQLISSQQTNRGAKRPLEDREISPGLGNKQRRSGGEIAQENVFAATLDRLEDLSDKAIMLGSHDDDLDNFGKYVASLLRGLPSERATELQKEVIDLILKSHVKDEPDSSEVDPLALEEQLPPQSSSDTTQTTTVQRKNFEDIISASRQLVEKSRTPNVQQTNEVNGRSSGKLASSGQNADSTLLQRNNTDEKRLLPDESPANDETECDDPVLETKRVDAALKRLECISEKVNMLSEKDDNFDTFGKYVASLLRYISADKAVELQQELINLILKARANTKT